VNSVVCNTFFLLHHLFDPDHIVAYYDYDRQAYAVEIAVTVQ